MILIYILNKINSKLVIDFFILPLDCFVFPETLLSVSWIPEEIYTHMKLYSSTVSNPTFKEQRGTDMQIINTVYIEQYARDPGFECRL